MQASDEMDPPRLSGREREVLAWFAHGQSCKDIAAHLGISSKTVDTYPRRLMAKRRLTNMPQLIRYAIENEADMTMPVPT